MLSSFLLSFYRREAERLSVDRVGAKPLQGNQYCLLPSTRPHSTITSSYAQDTQPVCYCDSLKAHISTLAIYLVFFGTMEA